jgi:hypothetical protein
MVIVGELVGRATWSPDCGGVSQAGARIASVKTIMERILLLFKKLPLELIVKKGWWGVLWDGGFP